MNVFSSFFISDFELVTQQPEEMIKITSCRSQMFFKIGVFKNFAIFTEIPVLESQGCNFFFKMRFQHRPSPMNIAPPEADFVKSVYQY